MRSTLFILQAITLIILVGLAFFSCKSASSAGANALYTAQQGACVDRFDSSTDIDACREEVRIRWHRLPDGGPITEAGGEQ